MPAPEFLFVYGTLHPERAPAAMQPFVCRLRFVGAGAIRGRLLDLGEYPGIIEDASALTTVSGTVWELPGDPDLLAVFDDYEGFLAHDPAQSLFLRVTRTVTMIDGIERLCWVYLYNGLYNGPVEEASAQR